MPLEQTMWVEKYRPEKLADLADQEGVKERLRSLMAKPAELPHLLFAGPPGCGKTTTAMIVARDVLGPDWREYTLSLNASDERGIDMVRERVKTFARYVDRREGVPFRLVILDECDEMCLHPETSVIVGAVDDLHEATLKELLERHGDGFFSLPTFDPKGRRTENDVGKVVVSGTAELYRVTLDDGRHILASANHPFFVFSHLSHTTVSTKELRPGDEVADFSDRFLRCYNCSRPFYRKNQFSGYQHHFCSIRCRNVFFGSISSGRTVERRREISALAHEGMKRSGVQLSPGYRKKRSEIAKDLIATGRIPNPRTWRKFEKGEGAWTGKSLSKSHKQAISAGDRKYFEDHPEVRKMISDKVKASLADPNGAYRDLVGSGYFKGASMRAYLASVEYWKRTGFRSKTELKMAGLLDRWNIPYTRERLVFHGEANRPYPFTVDFVIGEKVALLVNGCWWHVCPTCGVRPDYPKQRANMEKDSQNINRLEELGYRVVIVWEHELRNEATIEADVVPRVYEAVGIAGGSLPKVRHARVKSVERYGTSPVLNISVVKNKNFYLANGILTHNTSDAQTALRRIMEDSSGYTRFILLCNYSSGIIEPLQSRSAIFRFRRLDEGSVVAHLKKIAKHEGLDVESDEALTAIYEGTQGDLRQAINMLQASASLGRVTLESVRKVTGTTVRARVAQVISAAVDGDFEGARAKMVELTRVYGVPERDFLKFANEAVGALPSREAAQATKILAEYDFRLVQGAQPELQLTAMLAELSSLRRAQ